MKYSTTGAVGHELLSLVTSAEGYLESKNSKSLLQIDELPANYVCLVVGMICLFQNSPCRWVIFRYYITVFPFVHKTKTNLIN